MGLLGLAVPVRAQTGLLVVAHGAGAEWNDGVRQVVSQLRWNGPVATAFLMGDEAPVSGWDSAAAALARRGVREIVVVPLMVSSHGGHYRQIRFYAGELTEWPADLSHQMHGTVARPPVPMRVTEALDAAPELGIALLSRWRELSDRDRRRPLLLVAHGPTSDHEATLWTRDLDAAASEIRQRGGISVSIGLLRDDAPAPVRAAAVAGIRGLIDSLAARAGDSVAVMPVLISRGSIATATIPADLSGLAIRYAPVALTPLPALARWIERVALAKLDPPQ